MKLYSLISFSNFYKEIANQQMDISTAYKINKILLTMNSDIEFYQIKLQEILNDCVELENGEFKMSSDNQNFILKKDKIDEFNTRFDELQNIDIDFDETLKLDIDTLEQIKITPLQLGNIQEFLK